MSILSFHSGFDILYLTKLTEQNDLQKKKKKKDYALDCSLSVISDTAIAVTGEIRLLVKIAVSKPCPIPICNRHYHNFPPAQ